MASVEPVTVDVGSRGVDAIVRFTSAPTTAPGMASVSRVSATAGPSSPETIVARRSVALLAAKMACAMAPVVCVGAKKSGRGGIAQLQSVLKIVAVMVCVK